MTSAYDFGVAIIEELYSQGYTSADTGCDSSMEGGYCDTAQAVAGLITSGQVDRGILM